MAECEFHIELTESESAFLDAYAALCFQRNEESLKAFLHSGNVDFDKFRAQVPKRRPVKIDLDFKLRNWCQIVQDVEQGRLPFTDSEYASDLGTRTSLEEIIQAAPKSLAEKVLHFLGPLDKRFMDATMRIHTLRSSV